MKFIYLKIVIIDQMYKKINKSKHIIIKHTNFKNYVKFWYNKLYNAIHIIFMVIGCVMFSSKTEYFTFTIQLNKYFFKYISCEIKYF